MNQGVENVALGQDRKSFVRYNSKIQKSNNEQDKRLLTYVYDTLIILFVIGERNMFRRYPEESSKRIRGKCHTKRA